MKSTFEKIGGTYTLGADGIYYSNLVSTDEEPHYGKYGMIRKTYLKEHRPAMYSLYMLEDRLTKHLNAVDDEALYFSPVIRVNCADIAFDIYNSHNRYEHSQNQHYNIFHNDLLKIK